MQKHKFAVGDKVKCQGIEAIIVELPDEGSDPNYDNLFYQILLLADYRFFVKGTTIDVMEANLEHAN